MRGRRGASALSAVMVTALVVIAITASARASSSATVGCGYVAGSTGSGTADRSRVVLGVVSVPPARIQRAVTDPSSPPWSYFAKYGVAIHVGSKPVRVSVGAGWARRAAITWGPPGAKSAVRFQSCHRSGGLTGSWNGYAGGFYIKAPTACVPITVTVGRRSRTVRVGVGTSCSKS